MALPPVATEIRPEQCSLWNDWLGTWINTKRWLRGRSGSRLFQKWGQEQGEGEWVAQDVWVTLFCLPPDPRHCILWGVVVETKAPHSKLHSPVRNTWGRPGIGMFLFLIYSWDCSCVSPFPTESFSWALHLMFPVREGFLYLPSLGWSTHQKGERKEKNTLDHHAKTSVPRARFYFFTY